MLANTNSTVSDTVSQFISSHPPARGNDVKQQSWVLPWLGQTVNSVEYARFTHFKSLVTQFFSSKNWEKWQPSFSVICLLHVLELYKCKYSHLILLALVLHVQNFIWVCAFPRNVLVLSTAAVVLGVGALVFVLIRLLKVAVFVSDGTVLLT